MYEAKLNLALHLQVCLSGFVLFNLGKSKVKGFSLYDISSSAMYFSEDMAKYQISLRLLVNLIKIWFQGKIY